MPVKQRHCGFALLISLGLFFCFGTTAFAASSECLTKDISDYQWRVRHPSAIPAQIEAEPGDTLNACVTLNGVGKHPLIYRDKKIELSVNNGPYEVAKDISIHDGDTLHFRLKLPDRYNAKLVIRLNFKETDEERRHQTYRMLWQIQTKNTKRKPETFRVGPSSPQFREMVDVLPQLVAGDTVILEEGAVYEPFDANFIPGTRELPITVVGDTQDPAKRPVFRGGTKRFNWTIGLKGSHNWVFKNIILEKGGLCFRNEADNTVLEDVLIRHCNTGIQASDMNSGSVTLKNIEMYDSGGKADGRPWGHGIYLASDQHSFPGATLTITNSYLHDNRGNTVKSRFQNTVVENSWIESGTHHQSKYLLELIGYDGRYDFYGQTREVKNNIFVHSRPGLGTRVGGDGNSPSRGSADFHDNLYVIANDYNRTLVRTYEGLRSLSFNHNTLVFVDEVQDLTLITDELKNEQWVEGQPIISIQNNVITQDTELLERDHGSMFSSFDTITTQANERLDPLIINQQQLDDARPVSGEYIRNIHLR